MSEKRVYLNKGGGTHWCLDGTMVPPGATVETEEDLVAKFGSRFVVVEPPPVGTEKTAVQMAAEADAAGRQVPEGGPLAPPALPPASQVPVVQAPVAPENAADGERAGDGARAAGAHEGMTDVTADFPIAAGADLAVCRDKQGWWVFDGDEEPANSKPLKKKDVNPFLEEYLAE